jgi:cytoskeletal protein RodZ
MVEIGQTIAKAREEKGLQLEEIAEQTRISLKYLQDLEQGKFDFLPRPYVIAYMKTFARIVGLDGETLLKTWREREAALARADEDSAESDQPLAPLRKTETQPVAPPPSEPRSRIQPVYSAPEQQAPATIPYVKEIAAGLALLGAMALLLYFSTTSSKRAANPPPEPAQEIPFDQVAREAETRQAEAPAEAIVESVPVKKPMRLEVRAQDAVWVQVVTDKRDSTDYSMRAGNVQAWQALEQFYVRVGNAAAVNLLLDGKDLGVIGSSGQVGGLLITHEGIKTRRLRGAARAPAVQEQPSPTDTTANN